MQHLKKRPIIRFLAVIFSVVLGALLVSYQPAFADEATPQELIKEKFLEQNLFLPSCRDAEKSEKCILNPDTEYDLDLNYGYRIKLKDYKTLRKPPLETSYDCYKKAIYAKFTFVQKRGRRPNKEEILTFSETYPIQADWELHFNTPLSGTRDTSDGSMSTGTLKIKSDPQCPLEVEVYPNQTLQLFSGIKSTQDEEIGNGRRIVNRRNPSGNFALGRDYYAARPIGDSSYDCNDNQENYYDVEQKICYQKLGSLSPITGKNFPGLGGVSVAQIIIKPDSIRAPHWHLQFAETGYCYEGLGQVGVIVPSHTIPKDYKDEDFYKEKIIEEIFLKPNEVFLFPEGSQHYLRNIGNEDFKCILFFAEGPPLNGDQLLSISLQNIVGNTPVGVLDSVFVANDDGTINKVSDSPAQNFSSKDQRSKVIPVVQACSGDLPNIEDPGCSPDSKRNVDFQFPSFLYSDVDP